MIARSEFISTKNYLLILILHYCLFPVYFFINLVVRKKPRNNRIILIELGHLGDMLTTAPIAELIKKTRNDCYLICLCSPSGAMGLRNNIFVDEICTMNLPMWYRRQRSEIGFIKSFQLYLRTLRNLEASTVINVRTTSYHIDHIAVWLSGAIERVGFGNKGLNYLLTYSGGSALQVPIPIQKMELASGWLKISYEKKVLHPVYFSELQSANSAKSILHEIALNENDLIIGINPGAQHTFLWPQEYFVTLCKMIQDRFTNVKILFFGTVAHHELVKAIQSKLGFQTFSVVGKTTLDEVFESLKLIKLLITVDTGIRHLANSAGIPVIALRSGAEGYERWSKYTENEDVIIHRVSCSPCGEVVCPRSEMICMTRIVPEEVFKAVMPKIEKAILSNNSMYSR